MQNPELSNRKKLISKEIEKLLWRHDCVIIPGFGGLIGNTLPCQIHPVTHTFSPPSKQILFNKNLQTDDGLLINSLAGCLEMTYNQTRDWTNEFFSDFSERLKSGEKQNLDKVGAFQTDVEGNIRFTQSADENFLAGSYGLPFLHAYPINRNPLPERREKKIPENIPLISESEKKIKTGLKRRQIATLLAVLILCFTGFLFHDPVSDHISALKINPFISEPSVFKISPIQVEVKPIIRKVFLIPRSDFSAESAKIFIVDGCYSSENNANGRVEYLQEKGYNATLLDQTPSGLFRVISGSYSDITEAEKELNDFHRKISRDAWLLIR